VAQDTMGARREPANLDFRARKSPTLGQTFDEDLSITLELLRGAGFVQVIAVDHTRAEFGVPVVSVVVPGMREPETD